MSKRSREVVPRSHANHQHAFHSEFAGALPFGRMLGPAGEQFIEQTPWANPNHPSHRQLMQQELDAQSGHPGLPSGSRRHPQQQRGIFSLGATATLNGDPPVATQKASGHDCIKGPKMGAEHPAKRDSIAQIS